MRVLKFGGTSVADAAAIRRLVAITDRERQAADGRAVVVVSALAGVTDQLVALAKDAGRGDGESALAGVDELEARHDAALAAVDDAALAGQVRQAVDEQCHHLRATLRALAVIRELTPRSLDAVVATGELMSSRLVTAALESAGVPAAWTDPRSVIVTDEAFTAATPWMDETCARLGRWLGPLIAERRVPVTGGFVGATTGGATTTLGRGGSDYSASIVGAGLRASEIQIWTDVDGMLTADPRIVPDAFLVGQLSFDEAAELAYFGAKVLHPKTIQPAMARGIPVRILNSRRPEGTGTLITAAAARTGAPVAALACKRDVTVVTITSSRMLMAYGFLRTLFEVFERFKTSVDVVTTSEVSVSVTLDDKTHLQGLLEALSAFADVSVQHNLALVGVVGDDLPTEPRTFARIVGALDGIPLRLVSQAASRRNVTLVIDNRDVPRAMAQLHEAFFQAGPGRPGADAVSSERLPQGA